jgi:hypothetical protein
MISCTSRLKMPLSLKKSLRRVQGGFMEATLEKTLWVSVGRRSSLVNKTDFRVADSKVCDQQPAAVN